MADLIADVFGLSPEIRYVAVYREGRLESRARAGLANASASESDKYEELIVNPTLLKLVGQRGDIDCGGARFVIIRYGNFWELVHPAKDGHVSVGMELRANPQALQPALEGVLAEHGILSSRAG
jgi:hypothetical protein